MFISHPSDLTQSDFDNNEDHRVLSFEDPRLDDTLTDLVWSIDRLVYPAFTGSIGDLRGLA